MIFQNSYKFFLLLLSLVMLSNNSSGQEPALAVKNKKKVAERPNILLIVSEDNGPELGCYGDPYVRTPNIDRLSANGVRFAKAFVPTSVCSPSRGALLTGIYPHQNGQIGLATHKYSMYRSFSNLPQLLHDNGYRTGIMGKLHVNPSSAFPFDFKWNDSKSISFNHRDVESIAEKAGEFFSEQNESPFFLMVNYPDAHFPLLKEQHGYPVKSLEGADVKTLAWVGADTARLRDFTANYYNCLMRLDDGIGLLLEKLKESGAADNTLIIYMGDHGTQFSRGKTSLYDSGLQVPLIFHWPEHISSGHVVKNLVSTLDIFPTILKALDIKIPDHLEGKALQPLLAGQEISLRNYVFGERSGDSPELYHPQRTVRDSRFRLIENLIPERPNIFFDLYADHLNPFFAAGTERNEVQQSHSTIQQAYDTYAHPGQFELYDLESDPHAFKNLVKNPEYTEHFLRLKNELNKWRNSSNDPLIDSEKLRLFTEEHERLNLMEPRYGYKKDPEFQWKYPEYFGKAR